MTQEKLFASFLLDQAQGVEIALRADQVTEATPILGDIQKLPGSVDFLEGFMHLRDDVIPVINLKKRLGFTPDSYPPEAKVAVISHFNTRYGLLFEDIREVFRAKPEKILPINPALRTDDQVISALIKLEPGKRAVELLDLDHLFADTDIEHTNDQPPRESIAKQVTYSRYVVFTSGQQDYGVSVDIAREITFCREINEIFKTGIVAGAIELRGRTIPIMATQALLTNSDEIELVTEEHSRILILSSNNCSVGMIVDHIKEITTVADDSILPFPYSDNDNVKGLLSRPDQQDIILLDVHKLLCNHSDAIKSMANIGNDPGQTTEDIHAGAHAVTHHLITENCYLIFSIGKNFAIEIKDVNEILENDHVMKVPGASGCSTEVINLRGEIVPIINLRNFYQFDTRQKTGANKLIICSAHGQTVALEVDQIVTIYKQEQFYTTPSLGNQLRSKKDTLDRLIEYLNDEGGNEHVLVLNIHSLIRNHLQLETKSLQAPDVRADDRAEDTITEQPKG